MGNMNKKTMQTSVNLKLIQQKPTLTSIEAMVYLELGPTKFWKLVESGELKGWKVTRWRFERKDLDKFKSRMMMEVA
jgi:excisionase family DNA binding protein